MANMLQVDIPKSAKRLSALPVPGDQLSKIERRASSVRKKSRNPTSTDDIQDNPGPSTLNCKKMLDEISGTFLEIKISKDAEDEEDEMDRLIATQRASLQNQIMQREKATKSERRQSKEKDPSKRVSIRDFDGVYGVSGKYVDDEDEELDVKESAVARRAKMLRGQESWEETQAKKVMQMQMVGRSGLQRLRNKLRRIRHTAEYGKAMFVLDEMRLAGYQPDAASYANAIQVCAAAEKWTTVLKLFDSMIEERQKPDRQCYIITIHAAERSNNWERAKQLLSEMKARNLEPDMEAYYVAARACQRGEEWGSTFDLLTEMHMRGLKTENAEYQWDGKLPPGLAKITQSWEDKEGTRLSIEKIAARQARSSHMGSRNRSTLNSSDTSFSGTRSASRSMSRMDSPGLEGLVSNVEQQMDVPAKVAALAEASMEIWRDQLRKLKNDSTQWELTLQILEEMKNQGHRPDIVSYNACLTTCAGAKQWDKVLQLFKDMQEDGHKADKPTYKNALLACERLGRWEEVLELIKEMKARGMGNDETTYRMAIRACERGQQWEKAYSLLNEVIQKNNRAAALLPNPGEPLAPTSPTYGPSGGVWSRRKRGQALDSLS